jgi:hypothetical protein
LIVLFPAIALAHLDPFGINEKLEAHIPTTKTPEPQAGNPYAAQQGTNPGPVKNPFGKLEEESKRRTQAAEAAMKAGSKESIPAAPASVASVPTKEIDKESPVAKAASGLSSWFSSTSIPKSSTGPIPAVRGSPNPKLDLSTKSEGGSNNALSGLDIDQ